MVPTGQRARVRRQGARSDGKSTESFNRGKIVSQRLNFYHASPDPMKALGALEAAIGKLGLEPLLLDLVKLRASQINGCAYCVDLHSSDARKKGDTERRINAVCVWRDTPFFSARERAALAWTEALTRLADTHAPDDDYQALRENF